MKVVEKKSGTDKVHLEATANTQEVDKAFQKAYIMFANQMNLQPEQDKTVPQVAAEKLGVKDLDSVVAPQVYDALIPLALDKRNIIPAYPPEKQGGSMPRRGVEFKFSLDVALKPRYELDSYEPVSITVPPFEPDLSFVEKELEQLAEQYAEYKKVDPRPVAKGDSCFLAIEMTQNGEVVKGVTTEGRTYTTGMGLMPDGFDEQIIGMEVGETKSFTFEGPTFDDEGNQFMEEYACTVTVKEIQEKQISDIDDEWVSRCMPMFPNAAALRKSIEDSISRDQRANYDNQIAQVAVTELAKRFQGRIEDPVYEAMQKAMLDNLRADLQQKGMTFDDFVEQNGGAQQFQMMMMMQIRQTLIQGYALDALFRHEKMVLEDADLDRAARELNPQNPKAVRMQMEESGQNFALREMAERIKANDWLVQNAKISRQ